MAGGFVFASKALTLERLQGRLSNSKIPPFVHFTIGEWESRQGEIVARIQEKFKSLIAVRSSALNEDTKESSMAGYFESVLDVDPRSKEKIQEAVQKVSESYRKKGNGAGENQVLVQEQVQNVQVSGVAFTRDLETGAPYYVINYDDYSGRTDIITSGSSNQQKIFTYCKLYENAPSDKYLAQAVAAARELEEITGNDAIDIEFVISGGEFFLLQARPIATEAARTASSWAGLHKNLEHIKQFIRENNQPFPNLAGQSTAYGVMPDWNPAEIIGIDPKPLAFSLYRYLITDTIWPLAREQVGYKGIGYHPGICSLGGKPYVDIRMSFNTFLPEGLSLETSGKLVDFYLRKLRRFQDFHDKVEFNVVYTCYVLDYGGIEKEMQEEGFTKGEIGELKKCLFTLTDSILSERITSIEKEMGLCKILAAKRGRIVASSIPLPTKISQLGHDCKMYGTLPFSKLARFAFIGSATMRSLLRMGIITQEEYERFYASISTVATDFLFRLDDLKNKRVSREEFLREYGHLRPGTYDICSRTYAESFDEYVNLENFVVPQKPDTSFDFSAQTKAHIQEQLALHGFSISAQQLLEFIRKATAARELSKLEFTKNLSLMLRYIEEYLRECRISREDIAFLSINDILEFSHSALVHTSVERLKEKIVRNKHKYEMVKLVKLPPLIFMEKNVEYFRSTEMAPNFVTQRTVCAQVADISQGAAGADLNGKIVLIENADPGYDWIFSHRIAGLVTEFGGAASHMTIRAAEFRIPAAIGCGPTLFNYAKGCSRIELNCAAKQIKAIL
ncbi:Pyruvate phosphate dikinase, PEP/pyruvate binding domain [Candidatus Anstonella stagnisolia]|nr:Pyruvate phosphate dikinase, PEP/pyruvate binding domain [Candidatus Anstonella stagnisolia]